MSDTPACRSARAVLQRAVTGIPVGDEELEAALTHLRGCDDCAARVDIGPTEACQEVEDDLPAAAGLVREGEDPALTLPDLARHLEGCERCAAILAELVVKPVEATEGTEVRLDPDDLFERALTAALTEPDRIARRRAAEQLGDLERPRAAALSALAEAAAEDPEEEVRAAALEALDRLDDAVSISRRVIDAWAETPADAAPFIAGVLARLAGTGSRAGTGVTELTATPAREEGVALAGEEGVAGAVTREEGELWLTLNRLPPLFEKKMPVVAFPVALRGDAPPIRWSGGRPGLVRAGAPVTEGSLRLRLGAPERRAQAGAEELFERIYLLDAD